MSNVSDIKPWFREDIARTLASIYFANKSGQKFAMQSDYATGFASALSSVALAVGINPETFLSPEDIQKLREQQR